MTTLLILRTPLTSNRFWGYRVKCKNIIYWKSSVIEFSQSRHRINTCSIRVPEAVYVLPQLKYLNVNFILNFSKNTSKWTAIMETWINILLLNLMELYFSKTSITSSRMTCQAIATSECFHSIMLISIMNHDSWSTVKVWMLKYLLHQMLLIVSSALHPKSWPECSDDFHFRWLENR